MSDTTAVRTSRRIFIDKQSPRAYKAMLAAAETVRAVASEAGLDRELVELVNIRVSQMNGCAFCLDRHSRTALGAGETPQRIAVLPAWRDTELFTARERAALAVAEATTDPTDAAAQEQAYEAAREVFSDDELSALIWVAITINSFNRVSILSKHPVRPAPRQ
ncbi:carboxymuconolactone decarboxylase family protein [Streptomyces sp. NPDC026673]|uniref:carboxymuconolactone decarboxylase family protein n=1 Tax=Streptomyces sp. NPDC026673 TaxID=3155724 RepID=UPI0033E9F329